jgi:hypothetical protein
VKPMPNYRLDPDLFRKTVVRHTVRRLAWLMGMSVVTASVFFAAAAAFGAPGVLTLLPALPLVAALALGLGLALNWRRQLKAGWRAWDSFEVVVSQNALRRTTSAALAAEIVCPDVVAILEQPGDGLIVVTADRRRSIVLPQQLVGYADLRERLANWQPIERMRWGGLRYMLGSSMNRDPLSEALSSELEKVRATSTREETRPAPPRGRPSFGRLAIAGWLSLILLFALIWIFVPK